MFSKRFIIVSILALGVIARNSTYQNPILPGFHPDPSCIFVPEFDDTYFCASSSFLVFPGIPIHASKDLLQWKLISNVLSRPSQDIGLGTTKRATSGIWASTIRYRNDKFYVVTTHVYDDYAANATNRHDNFIFTTKNPFSSAAWSQPLRFNFTGYDTSPFWDDDGQVYITGTHAWQVEPGIRMIPIDLKTGVVGSELSLWNGTGASAPEGPHIYKKDGYYYLQIAEGGTGSGHRVSIARSKNITGPYESNPKNPVLTNSNVTTAYFQNVGHADTFQDGDGNWWAVALSVRQGPDGSYPMGRETILTPVTWDDGQWPVFTNVSGTMNGWHLEEKEEVDGGEGKLVTEGDDIQFSPGDDLPPEFVHWRFPTNGSYVVSPKGHENELQLASSVANITGLDGRSAETGGQTFVGRRQVDSLFTYSVNIDVSMLKEKDQEVGASVFLDQLHHWDIGVVMSPATNITTSNINGLAIRVRGITTVPVFIYPDIAVVPLNSTWQPGKITLEIKATNVTHYTFSAGPTGHQSMMQDFGYAPGLGLTWGFTGALLGVYATTNGGPNAFKTYVSDWKYIGQGQIIN